MVSKLLDSDVTISIEYGKDPDSRGTNKNNGLRIDLEHTTIGTAQILPWIGSRGVHIHAIPDGINLGGESDSNKGRKGKNEKNNGDKGRRSTTTGGQKSKARRKV